MEQPGLGCSQRDAYGIRSFPQRALLQFLNLNYDPEGGSQVLDGFLEHAFFFALGATSFRIRPVVGYYEAQAIRAKIIVTVRGNLKRGASLSENHERRVDGDAREPGSESGPAVKVRHVNKRSQECVLNCVFRVLAGSGNPMCGTKELLSISLGKRGEGG